MALASVASPTGWDAPGRCGILGNPSDIYGGAVLSCSLGVRNRCILRPAGAEVEPDDTRLWRAAASRFPAPFPCRVEWTSEVPRSSGLAGSTALLAATLACLREPTDPGEFAETVRDVERLDAGVMCGYQDAHLVVHGGLRLVRYTGKRPDVDGGPLPVHVPLEAPLPFLLITTGVQRLSGSVHAPMAARWLAGEREARDGIARLTELAEPGAEHLRRGDYAALGQLMDENEAIVRDLGGSGDSVDRLVALCRRYGALGAKLAGAGMGGTVIALTEDADVLEACLHAEGYTRFLRPLIAPGLRRLSVE